MNRLFMIAALTAILTITVLAGIPVNAQEEIETEVPLSIKSATPADPALIQGSTTGDTGLASAIHINTVSDLFPNIVVYVSVFDDQYNPVTGLTRDDFGLVEQSDAESEPVAEPVICFLEKTDTETLTGISFSLAFDLSDSMKGDRLDQARAAAIQFVSGCSELDRGSLISFSSGGMEAIESPVDWVSTDADTNGSSDLSDAITNLTPPDTGNTAVYDGAAKGIESLEMEPEPKFLILFSDGATNNDISYDINQVITMAIDQGVRIYTIGLGLDSLNLKQMAESTGGMYRFAPDASYMAEIYREMYTEMIAVAASRYTLCYTSHNRNHDGSLRTVTVTRDSLSGSDSYHANTKPVISPDAASLALASASVEPGVPVTVSGAIADTDAGQLGQSVSATLFYKPVGASSVTSIQLTLTEAGNGTYGFEQKIPGSAVAAPGVQWYVTATDGIATTSYPENPSSMPLMISSGSDLPPVITHTPVTAGTGSTALAITAEVSDEDLDLVRLYYRFHDPYRNRAYMSVSMAESAGTFSATIPGAQVTVSGIDYFISAWDTQGSRSDHGTVNSPHTIAIDGQSWQFPMASAGPAISGDTGDTLTLDGSGSYDPDGDDSLSYFWTQTSGTAAELSDSQDPMPTFTAPFMTTADTVMTFDLTVADPTCLLASDQTQAVISNTTPAAGFTWDPESPVTGTAVSFFDTSESKADIVSWQWSFGSAGTSTDQNPVFTFSSRGTVSVTLTVTDIYGTSDSVTHTLSIACSGGNCGSGSGCFISAITEQGSGGFSGVRSAAVLFGLVVILCICLAPGRRAGWQKVIGIAILLFSLTAPPASAANTPGFNISILGGGYLFDKDQDIDPGLVMGAALGYNFTDRFGVELMFDAGTFDHNTYNYDTCSCDTTGVKALVPHLDLLWHFRPDTDIVPYIAAGLGSVILDYDDTGTHDSGMANIGGGVKFFISPTVALRGDIRHIRTLNDSDSNLVVNFGLMVAFGGPDKYSTRTDASTTETTPLPVVPAATPVDEKPAEKPAAREPEPAPVTTPAEIPAPVLIAKPAPILFDSGITLLFDFDKAIIKDQYRQELDRLAERLKAEPDLRLTIEGHTCNMGPERYNQKLSEKRAQSVKDYFVTVAGIDPSRLVTIGYGELKPAADNATAAGRIENRRAIVIRVED